MSSHSDPLRAMIVDDEPHARAAIRMLLAGDPEVELVAECSGGGEAADRIRIAAPDIVFLDVQMPEVDGFEVLRRIGADGAGAIVFVTAHDTYAIRAFEAEALDYLLKPFDDARFYRTLERAKDRVRERRTTRLARALVSAMSGGSSRQPAATAYPERLPIREGGRVTFVAVADIDWIGAADYNVEIHAGGRAHLMRESLASLEARLDPRRFFRVHRSALVNVDRVRELQPHFHGELVVLMQDGARLRLSRGRRDQLNERLGLTP